MPNKAKAAFSLGRLIMTRGVNQLVQAGRLDPLTYLRRHASRDWGELCHEDQRLNDHSMDNAGRLMSSYPVSPTLTLWIITEWDRSVTTLLLPSEY